MLVILRLVGSLNFRFESQWVSGPDLLPSSSDSILIAHHVLTVVTCTVCVAEPSKSETFTVHFEATGLRTLTSHLLSAGRSLLKNR